MTIYCISGLGVDRRVFGRLRLPDGVELQFLDWIRPLYRETMERYAWRLAAPIDREKPFALMGLSFGGMIAVEMNRFLHPFRTILLSSAPTCSGLPPYLALTRFLPLHRVTPLSLLIRPHPLLHWLFGIRTAEEKELFRLILRDTDRRVLRWSIDSIVHWKNTTIPPRLVHIHGSADRLLPLRYTHPQIVVPGGTHFMVYSKAEEVSQILAGCLAEEKKSLPTTGGAEMPNPDFRRT